MTQQDQHVQQNGTFIYPGRPTSKVFYTLAGKLFQSLTMQFE